MWNERRIVVDRCKIKVQLATNQRKSLWIREPMQHAPLSPVHTTRPLTRHFTIKRPV